MAHIIAEAGTNHNGSPEKAKELIALAARAGADSVKFQLINTWGLYLPGEYEYGKYDIKEVIRLRQSTELSPATYQELADYSRQQGVTMSASVFDTEGLRVMDELDPPYIKIASSDLNNVRFLREVIQTDRTIILSTGMSTLADIRFSVNEMAKVGDINKVVLLHCVSVYPARTEETNLRFISKLKEEFGVAVGFSDHTQDSRAALMALGLGATWFEKHFTTDRSQEGLDHAYAMEEEGLRQYVADIRAGEKALEEKAETKISEAEYLTRRRARRALYAARDMEAGEIIRDEDVLCVRPEGPIQADQIDDVIGKRLLQPRKQHEPFVWEIIGG